MNELEAVACYEGIILDLLYPFAVDCLEVLEPLPEGAVPDLLDATGEDEYPIVSTTREGIVILDPFEDAILDYIVRG